MSGFGFGGGGGFRNPQDDLQLKAAKLEVEMLQDLYNRLSDLCFKKCMASKFKEPEMNLGEMTCTDRCVFKCLEANKKVGEVFQEFTQAEQARMQQQGMMQQQQ